MLYVGGLGIGVDEGVTAALQAAHPAVHWCVMRHTAPLLLLIGALAFQGARRLAINQELRAMLPDTSSTNT